MIYLNKVKLIIIVLFFTISVCIQVVAEEYKYSEKTDEFTGDKFQIISGKYGDKNIKIISSSKESPLSSLIIVSYAKFESSKNILFVVSVTNEYSNWNELGTINAYVILDGERWNKHKFDIASDVNNDATVSESYAFYYNNKSEVTKILNAKVMKIKVGNYVAEIDLSKMNLNRIKLD